MSEAKKSDGTPTTVLRLSNAVEYLPGFGENENVSVKVIGPVEFNVNNSPGIRKFTGGNSKNTNGNSVLLRLDYKSVRILLTGDFVLLPFCQALFKLEL